MIQTMGNWWEEKEKTQKETKGKTGTVAEEEAAVWNTAREERRESAFHCAVVCVGGGGKSTLSLLSTVLWCRAPTP